VGANIIDLKKIQMIFEEIPNVRVIKIFYDDVDLDWVGAVIVVDEDKLLILRNFREEDFSENTKRSIQIARIGNYRVNIYVYNPHRDPINQTWRSDLGIGRNTIGNKIFGLGEINGIINIIENFDLILYEVEQLPDDDISLSNPNNNYGFWNPHNSESKDNLLYIKSDNNMEYKIGKIKFGEIIDYSLLDENINYWDLIKLNN